MKRLILFFVFCCCFVFTLAQHEKDSLLYLLAKEKLDTSKVLLLSELAYTLIDKPDSMNQIAEDALKLAQKANFKKGQVNALLAMGMYYLVKESNAQALRNYLEALNLAQEIKDNDLIARANQNIGNIYYWANEYKVSNDYFIKVKNFVTNKGEELWLASTLLNIGSNYERLNILDSARYYVQQANELSLKLNFSPLKVSVLLSLGDIHAKMKLDKLALEYYRLSLNEAGASNSNDATSLIATAIARLYNRRGDTDSSFYYAKLSVTNDALLNRSPAIESLSVLVNYYKDHDNIDSAFFYHQKLGMVKDSLFGAEKTKQIQTLSFQESLRENRLKEESIKRETERINNLQVMGIGTFIIMCFLFLLLLNRRKTKPKVVRVFGIVLLLLIFEFISLLLHPFLEQITHHTPVLIFIALVTIASVLVPLHHKMEHWITHKMVEGSNNVVPTDDKQPMQTLERTSDV